MNGCAGMGRDPHPTIAEAGAKAGGSGAALAEAQPPELNRPGAGDEVEALRSRLFAAGKLAALGIAAGGVAHDLNNLFTVVIGHADLAMRDVDGASPLRGALEDIVLAAERGSALTQRLLASSSRRHVGPALLSVNAVVVSVVGMVGPTIPPSIAVRTRLEPGLWPVRADSLGLEQVVLNLVANARDAMPDGGTLTVRTGNLTVDETSQQASLAPRTGGWVCLTVADTGVGMDERTTAAIFTPFFTTKDGSGGAGLGLAAVRRVVGQHRGWIDVQTEPGEGARFRVCLPAATTEEESERQWAVAP